MAFAAPGRARSGEGRSASARRQRDENPRFIHDGKLFHFSGSIFEKLTDPALYTGTHKLRFDAHGRGRGVYGRDSYSVHVAEDKAGYGDDREGYRWMRGLRSQFHHPSTTPHSVFPHFRNSSRSPTVGHRSVSAVASDSGDSSATATTATGPGSSRAVPAPVFEAWVLAPDGTLVRDDRRSYAMMYGPNSQRAMPPDFEASEYLPAHEAQTAERVQRAMPAMKTPPPADLREADAYGNARGYGPSTPPPSQPLSQQRTSPTSQRRDDDDLRLAYYRRAKPLGRPADEAARAASPSMGEFSPRAFPHHNAVYSDAYVGNGAAGLRRVQPWERVMVEHSQNNLEALDVAQQWADERAIERHSRPAATNARSEREMAPDVDPRREEARRAERFWREQAGATGSTSLPAAPNQLSVAAPAVNPHVRHTADTAESYASRLRGMLLDDSAALSPPHRRPMAEHTNTRAAAIAQRHHPEGERGRTRQRFVEDDEMLETQRRNHAVHAGPNGSRPPSLEETLQLVQRYEQFHAASGARVYDEHSAYQ